MKTGALNAGDSVSLSQLANELEVSTTPIREALSQLEQVNLIKAIPNRGFIVAPINHEEIKPLYELIAALEVLAIENSSFSKEDLSLLKHYQDEFEATTNAIDRINADMNFHQKLTSNYQNETALQILGDLKMRIFFYEKEFMDEHGFYNDSESHHHKIINALEQGNKAEATTIIKANWLQILNYQK